MRIAFINDCCEHLGIQYLSAVLKKAGHETKLFVDPLLFDDEFMTFKSLARVFDRKYILINQLKQYDPGLMCISVVSSFYPWASQMAQMIKQSIHVPIIMGGVHPSSVPEYVIQDDHVDMVCIGEGEHPLLELANSLERGATDYSIRNIWFKKNRTIIKNEVRDLIENLDMLPLPDKELYYSESPHFSVAYYIAASRGCPHACSYCYNSYLQQLYDGKGNFMRQRSVKSVLDELMIAKERYAVKTVVFSDECFGMQVEWLKEFHKAYKELIDIPFHCSMFPSVITDQTVTYLKKAGCKEIEIGIQSWNEKIRADIFRRYISNDTMIHAFKLIKDQKINVITGDILGYPQQKEEHIIDTLLTYAEIRPTRSYPFLLKYYPKTSITEYALKKGILNDEDYDNILKGYSGKYLDNEKKVRKENSRYLFLFLLIQLLPKKIAQFIICKRWDKAFPVFASPGIISVLNNFLTSSVESIINRKKALQKYWYYIKKYIQDKKERSRENSFC